MYTIQIYWLEVNYMQPHERYQYWSPVGIEVDHYSSKWMYTFHKSVLKRSKSKTQYHCEVRYQFCPPFDTESQQLYTFRGFSQLKFKLTARSNCVLFSVLAWIWSKSSKSLYHCKVINLPTFWYRESASTNVTDLPWSQLLKSYSTVK